MLCLKLVVQCSETNLSMLHATLNANDCFELPIHESQFCAKINIRFGKIRWAAPWLSDGHMQPVGNMLCTPGVSLTADNNITAGYTTTGKLKTGDK